MDRELRHLERLAAQGDPQAAGLLLIARARSGAISIPDLELASWLGEASAVEMIGKNHSAAAFASEVVPELTLVSGYERHGVSSEATRRTVARTFRSTVPPGQPHGIVSMTLADWIEGLRPFGETIAWRCALAVTEFGVQVLAATEPPAHRISGPYDQPMPDDRPLAQAGVAAVRAWITGGQTLEQTRACGDAIRTVSRIENAWNRTYRNWWIKLCRAAFMGISQGAFDTIYEAIETGWAPPTYALRAIRAELLPTLRTAVR